MNSRKILRAAGLTLAGALGLWLFAAVLLPVLLPFLIGLAVAALVEKTCWQAIAPELELGMTTVGTSLKLAHTAPTPIGMVVQCDCEVLEVTDRRVRFGFRVYDDVTEVAGGEHERYLVDAERFLKKAESKI